MDKTSIKDEIEKIASSDKNAKKIKLTKDFSVKVKANKKSGQIDAEIIKVTP